ncbi:amidase domain-containing protein [Alicyclobacillus vulcanalis]|uniref:Putative amidase domain-containing protein n=1 Tax=Alicyclobacillus vulcanalis TaxID=252246 RepID=A0A1N7NXT7_9BACL|nr:amidase domain-containing protein [Alicyclobacillus vulcanalis]SIT03098.1 Putative amidase domain-containing protein [Alicyclobacillus vulcanalis]
MSSCIDALRSYFDTRARVWLHGSLGDRGRERLAPGIESLVHQAKQKRRAYERLGKRLVRVHTEVRIDKLEENAEKTVADVEATERICFTYQEAAHPSVECCLIRHQMRWAKEGGVWHRVTGRESAMGCDLVRETRGPQDAVHPRFPRDPEWQAGVYDRIRAVRYADAWWDGTNPRFPRFSDDCTNFVSQCLFAGGLPMWGESDRTKGWWFQFGSKPNWSYSWSTAQALYLVLTSAFGGQVVSDPSELKMGDVIFYDWNGEGIFHHSTLVTDFDAMGEPLVNAHTIDSYHRPWVYMDSPAWTPRTRYAWVHLPDRVKRPSR